MPNSYHLLHSEAFPQIADRYVVPKQVALEDADSPDTWLQRQDAEVPPGFEAFAAVHEVWEQRIGRRYGRSFDEFLARYDLNVYARRSDGLTIVEGPKAVVEDFRETLNTKTEHFILRPLAVDLDKLEALSEYIGGAWFRFPSATRTTAAYFGSHVDTHRDYKQAKREGTLRNLYIRFPFYLGEVSVMITASAGVVLFSKFETVLLRLELLLEIKEKLLDRGLHAPDAAPARAGRRRRASTPGQASQSPLPWPERP